MRFRGGGTLHTKYFMFTTPPWWHALIKADGKTVHYSNILEDISREEQRGIFHEKYRKKEMTGKR